MRRRLWLVTWPQVANDGTDLSKAGFAFLDGDACRTESYAVDKPLTPWLRGDKATEKQ
jgi:hypothetical protein